MDNGKVRMRESKKEREREREKMGMCVYRGERGNVWASGMYIGRGEPYMCVRALVQEAPLGSVLHRARQSSNKWPRFCADGSTLVDSPVKLRLCKVPRATGTRAILDSRPMSET